MKVKSYHQKFAQNAVVIEALLKFYRPSHGLLKFCDTLEITQGQENLGRKLLKGIMLAKMQGARELPCWVHGSTVASIATCHYFLYK